MGNTASVETRKNFWFGPMFDMRIRPGNNKETQSGLLGGAGVQLAFYSDNFQLKGAVLIGGESDYDCYQSGPPKTCYGKEGSERDCTPVKCDKSGRFIYGAKLQAGYNFLELGEKRGKDSVLFSFNLGGEYYFASSSDTTTAGSFRMIYASLGADGFIDNFIQPGFHFLLGQMQQDNDSGENFSNLFLGFDFAILF